MLPGITPALFGAGAGAAPALPQINDVNTVLLLHFDDTAYLSAAVGGAPVVATPYGTLPMINATTKKFGASSLALNGTNNWLQIKNQATWDFGSGDFTIDCWFNCTAAAGTSQSICGQRDSGGTATSTSFHIARSSSTSQMVGTCVVGGVTIYTVTSTKLFTNVDNPGWHHLAFVRASNVLKLFIDGVQEGGDVAISGALTVSPNLLGIGIRGESTSGPFTGYIDEFRISKGVARWTANFTPEIAAYGPDADNSAWSTVLLMHMDGANNSTIFPESSRYNRGNASFTGTAVVLNTSPSCPFPPSTVSFSGSTPSLSHTSSEDFNFGAGDFTIDWWDYRSTSSAVFPFMSRGNAATAFQPYTLYSDGTNQRFYASSNGTSWDVCNALNVGANATTTWAHYAITRKDGTFYGFRNGVLQATQASSVSMAPHVGPQMIGYRNNNGTPIYIISGQIDELRIVKGIAAWTANFTVATLPYFVSAAQWQQKLLMHFDGTEGSTVFNDSAVCNNGNATVNGTPIITTATSKFGGASAAFNGTSWVQYSNGKHFVLLAVDWSVDVWARVNATGVANSLWGRCNSTSTNGHGIIVNANGTVSGFWLPSDAAFQTITTAALVTDTNWHHYMLSRVGTTIRLFFDGVQAASGAIGAAASITDSASSFVMGRCGSNTTAQLNGNLDEMRYMNGVGVSANFTPPTAPYTTPP